MNMNIRNWFKFLLIFIAPKNDRDRRNNLKRHIAINVALIYSISIAIGNTENTLKIDEPPR